MKQWIYRFVAGITSCLWILYFYLLLARSPFQGKIRTPEYGVHAVFFFLLAFMTLCSQPKPRVFWTLMALYLFGCLTEMTQHFNPPRTCGLEDLFEDMIGSSLGVFAALLLRKLLRAVFPPLQSVK
ncbi:MAG: VanZ family protein [Planctomycetaceae bacterium]|jgi:VanZ family protein|nr:VanZ family protein [Planctomycetaceae bacterium]